MAIITISRGSFSHGKRIAEKVADAMHYTCMSREILLEASKHLKVSEKELLHSIHDAPSILERMTHGRDKYLLSIRAALLERAAEDNLVYCGHAGHLLIPEIRKVLKVRVIAEVETRALLMEEKEKVSREKALSFLKKEDKQRELWTRYLYKVDIHDPELYDMILNMETMTIDDACAVICTAAMRETFRMEAEDLKQIQDLAITSHVKASLHDICESEVSVRHGKVFIRVSGEKIKRTAATTPELQKQVQEKIQENLMKNIMDIVNNIPEVKDVVCDVEAPYYS